MLDNVQVVEGFKKIRKSLKLQDKFIEENSNNAWKI